MNLIRIYFLTYVQQTWRSKVYQDLDILINEWKISLTQDNDIIGFVHIGFSRPESSRFVDFIDKYHGKIILTENAKWVLNDFSQCSSVSIGQIDNLHLYIALNGWGYVVTAEEIGLSENIVNAEADNNEPYRIEPNVSLNNEILEKPIGMFRLSTRAINCLKDRNINNLHELVQLDENELLNIPNMGKGSINEINRLLSENNLYFGMSNHSSDESHNLYCDDHVHLIKSSPDWFKNKLISKLAFSKRTLNCLLDQGYTLVGELEFVTNEMLFAIPNFGTTSKKNLIDQLKKEVNKGLESQNITTLKLIDLIKDEVASLENTLQSILKARMGLGKEAETLEEIASKQMPKLTRERIRQLEKNAIDLFVKNSFWMEILENKLNDLLDDREDPLLFLGLTSYDSFFEDIKNIQEPFEYLLENKFALNRRFSIIEINGQLVVTRLKKKLWVKLFKEMEGFLKSNIDKGLTESVIRQKIDNLLISDGYELRSELWEMLKRHAIFSEGNTLSDAVMVGYGQSETMLIKSVLLDSSYPLHYTEVQKLVLDRFENNISIGHVKNTLNNIAISYGKGHYGFLKHSILNADERAEVSQEILEIISNSDVNLQWSYTDLINLLYERGLSFEGRLNPYSLDVSLFGVTEIKRLGRHSLALVGVDSLKRIDTRQAIEALLISSGKPLSTLEIKNEIQKVRGVNKSFQIHPRGSVVNIGVGIWGLIERDIPLDEMAQKNLINEVLSLLELKGNGIHITEIIDLLTGIFAQIDDIQNNPYLVFAICKTNDRIASSQNECLYLKEWGEDRRLNSRQAIILTLQKVSPDGLSANDLIKSASSVLGWDISKESVRFNPDIHRDVISGKWVLSEGAD